MSNPAIPKAAATELMRTPGYINAEFAEILAKEGMIWTLKEDTDVPALRKTLQQRKLARTPAPSPDSSIKETDHSILTRDGSQITVRVYAGPNSINGPVMVMLHGGGYILGDLDDDAPTCRRWCELFHGVAINVGYRLAPEFPFPIPVLDCYDAVKWTAAHPETHGGDLAEAFIVAGESAGANMAITASHLARDEGMSPPITGLYLSIPGTMAPDAVPERWKNEYRSRDEHKDAPLLGEGAIELIKKLYVPDPFSPLMSPALFPTGHKNLPPAYFQVCGMDQLRDEGLIYEKMLREEAEVPTKLDVYPGLPHSFWSKWPEASFSQKHTTDSIEGLKWLLKWSSS